jgi:hypothetical protein
MANTSSWDLCKYRDTLGKPNEGIRKIRIFNLSAVDVALTFVLGLVFSKIFNTTKFNGIMTSFLLSIVFHQIFCVDTTINKYINKLINKG